MPFQNSELAGLASETYSKDSLRSVEVALRSHHTLTFDRLPSGLFPACRGRTHGDVSGYSNVWVRDNIYIAYAHLLDDQPHIAVDAVRAIFQFYTRYRYRFDDLIRGVSDPENISLRPHVRFDGHQLAEIANESWGHAQNDALGYLLWLSARLVRDGYLDDDEMPRAMLALLPRYFAAISFWEDEDSGHWEEQRKISASSIGVVVAGLDSLLAIAHERPKFWNGWEEKMPEDALVELAERGRLALRSILPHECAQPDPYKNRRYDSSLLFLLHPLNVIDGAAAELLVHDVKHYLEGEFGIRRYLRDSFWAPGYDELLSPQDRTRDFSQGIEARDLLFNSLGEEAQWCIFDPLLSAYFGQRFARSGASVDRELQSRYFNRALAQVSPEWECPELYYQKNGRYVQGPQSPLQWTQANLLIALLSLRKTVSLGGQ